MKIIWVRSRLQNPEISKDAASISSFTGDLSINQPFIVLTETKFSYRYIPVWARYSPHLHHYINRGIVSIKAVKRDLQLADVGTASRGYPQLQQMGAIIHGEA
jgi:hypothetical protein